MHDVVDCDWVSKGTSTDELIRLITQKQEMDTGHDCSGDIKFYKEQIARKVLKRRDLIEAIISMHN